MAEEENTPSEIQLDLDALSPKRVQIKFQDKLIQVEPPTLEQYALVLEYGTEMENLQDNANPHAVAAIYQKIQSFIVDVIPDLKDVKLNYKQIIAVFQLLAQLGNPTDDATIAELKKRGITLPTQGDSSPKDLASPQQ